jgi:hypothetical protein
VEEIKIKDNLIFTNNQLSVVFKIDPLDLIILPEQEQKAFETDMKKMLNSIGENSIQIIMRTRKATKLDLGKHFSSFNTQYHFYNKDTENKTKQLLSAYIGHLIDLLEKNIIPVKEYYLILKQEYASKSVTDKFDALNNLERFTNRICSNLKRAGINLEQVKQTNRNLENLIQSFTRI